MENKLRELYFRMVEFDRGDPLLIQHFTKVHSYASLIARSEGLDEKTVQTIEAAALVHDIAIPFCMEKYGSDAGKLQEKEGPAMAEKMLSELAFPAEMIERVAALVGEHHTYVPMDGIDHQILVEADFIVNSFESNHAPEARKRTLENIFKTETGKKIYSTMYNL